MRTRIPLALAAFMLASLPLPAAAEAHHHHAPAPSAAPVESKTSAASSRQPEPSIRGRFIVHCQPTVRDRIDPIVTPGVYGRSHEHDFYGPVSLSAEPSKQRILAYRGATSCSAKKDRSVYWHPTLLHDGVAVMPYRTQAYYNITNLTTAAPRGLSYIAGSPGTTRTDGVRVRWVCGGDGDDRSSNIARPCEKDESLMAAVSFPGCWDGQRLGSADYTSHMAYADSRGRCPASHPKHIPQLDLYFQWDSAIVSGPVSGLALSSGSTGGLHADVMFG